MGNSGILQIYLSADFAIVLWGSLDLEGTEFSGTFTSEIEQGIKAVNSICLFYSSE